MAFFDNVHYTSKRFTETDGMEMVLEADLTRRNIIFYNLNASDASGFVSFTGADTEAIELLPAMMWEPKITPVNEIHINAPADCLLLVMVAGNNPWLI